MDVTSVESSRDKTAYVSGNILKISHNPLETCQMLCFKNKYFNG